MRRRSVVALQLGGVPTLAYVVAVVLAPGRAALLTHVYAVVITATALGALVRLLGRSLRPAGPSIFEAGLEPRPERATRAAQLERLERQVAQARQNAWDLHNRLRPILRETASGLLAGRGIDLDRQERQASALLGEEAWELVRSGQAPPEDRHGPGVTAAELDRVLTALERL